MLSGRVLTHPTLARRRFQELLDLPEPLLDLAEASLVIALEDQPSLDIAPYLEQLSGWATAIQGRLHGSVDVEKAIDAINRLLFLDEGFHGEEEDYYDPKSAFLNETLDRHSGLPITLSILYLELSRRIGVEATGISFPGRFLVKFSGAFGTIIVDPFDGGRVLAPQELQRILDGLYGGGVRLREQLLRSSSRREILARELAQLKAAYLAQHDLSRAAASADRLLLLDDHDAYEVRDRATLALQMHAYGQAIRLLEQYLVLVPHAEDRGRIREQIAYLRAWHESRD